jgi:L-ascorbate metabolism protein UlaG (beta-lactamase superfamily)
LPSTKTLTATLVGGPTTIIDFAGLRLVTDPTFDPPGEQPRGLVKLHGPALDPDAITNVDAVLLSHDHHPDNLDNAGRAFLDRADRVLTTTAGAARLGGNAEALEPWASTELKRPDGQVLTVTAVPAQHGPDGSDEVMGPVIGFVLTGEGLPSVYVSGDNASLEVVRRIVDRLGTVEIAVLFAGAASLPQRFDGAPLTLSSDAAAEATTILAARSVLPVHLDGWAHFSEGLDDLRRAFQAHEVADRLAVARPGATVHI